MRRNRRHLIAPLAVAAALALLAGACSDDGGDDTTTPSSTGGTTPSGASTTAAPDGVTVDGISDARCAANKAAGTITYLSSFDFAAAASIVDVVMADELGFFDRLCLKVELKPGFSTSNYPLVASGAGQFSSAGNYTELVQNDVDGAGFVAVVDYGKTAIEGLVVRQEDPIRTLADLKGKVIGVKGALPPSLIAMLATAGLHQGDWQELLLDGFDPVAQLQTSIDALPVYKSNEPGQLDAAGIKYRLFDPLDFDVPGSFGILYTTRSFIDEHPTAAADFVRAALAGYAAAAADPAKAVDASVERINAAGNKNYLTKAGELFRWQKESSIVAATTPAGEIPGLIDPVLFTDEISAMVDAGVFDEAPDTDGTFDPSIAEGVLGPDGAPVLPKA